MKTKFLSKFHQPCSYKQEETEEQKKRQKELKNHEAGTNEEAGSIPENAMKISEKKDLLSENYNTQTLKLQGTCFLQVCEEYGDESGETEEQIEGNDEYIPSNGPRRKMSTHFDKLRSLLKPKNRRDAICDEMEKKIEPAEGVSLRQYRKFLATSSVLQELKML